MAKKKTNADETIVFADGDIIYRQNAKPTGVYMILEGHVEIWHEHAGKMTLVATIGDGELLGEVSAIQKAPHSVTAKAKGIVKSLFIPTPAFRRSFADPLVRRVVQTMAARLKSSYVKDIETKWTPPRHDGRPENIPTIEAGSHMVASCLLTYVELKAFPFVVGGFAGAEGKCIIDSHQLKLPLAHTAELADNHFEIVTRDGQLWVRDLGSPQGTIVNGQPLSRYTMTATARLKTGENIIVAGGAESPIRFIATLPDTER